jgi:hypothetical protein
MIDDTCSSRPLALAREARMVMDIESLMQKPSIVFFGQFAFNRELRSRVQELRRPSHLSPTHAEPDTRWHARTTYSQLISPQPEASSSNVQIFTKDDQGNDTRFHDRQHCLALPRRTDGLAPREEKKCCEGSMYVWLDNALEHGRSSMHEALVGEQCARLVGCVRPGFRARTSNLLSRTSKGAEA